MSAFQTRFHVLEGKPASLWADTARCPRVHSLLPAKLLFRDKLRRITRLKSFLSNVDLTGQPQSSRGRSSEEPIR